MSEVKINQEDRQALSSVADEDYGKLSDLVSTLQTQLNAERDARREDRFVYLTLLVILLDVVFFSVIDGLGGPLALLVLELLILIPLAYRLGMEEIAQIISGVLSRVAGKTGDTSE